VPLCGKSLDLGWLVEQGHDVVGVELSEQAVSDLFVDLGRHPVISTKGACEAWRSESLEILVGDIFELDPSLIGPFDGVWDRAALVALNKTDRARYVPWILHLLKSGGRGLLSTLSYDQTQMKGPPFSVTADEVDSLYHAAWTLEQLERVDVAQRSPLFIEAGIDQAYEETWLIGQ
jgi:thiopurine S-methyltransferase